MDLHQINCVIIYVCMFCFVLVLLCSFMACIKNGLAKLTEEVNLTGSQYLIICKIIKKMKSTLGCRVSRDFHLTISICLVSAYFIMKAFFNQHIFGMLFIPYTSYLQYRWDEIYTVCFVCVNNTTYFNLFEVIRY